MSLAISRRCWPLRLPPTTKLVLMSLADHAKNSGRCWPSIPRLCERTGLSRSSVIRALSALESAGWIATDRRVGRHSYYWVTPPPAAEPMAVSTNVRTRIHAGQDEGDGLYPPDTRVAGAPTSVTQGHPGRCDTTPCHGDTDPCLCDTLTIKNHQEPSLEPVIEASSMGGSALPIHRPANETIDEAEAETLSVSDKGPAVQTQQAVIAFNAILAKPAGLLSAVHLVNDVRREQVRRTLPTAKLICAQLYGVREVTPEFWRQYFEQCAQDPWKRGEGPYAGVHANWRPDFEYLTRKAVMTAVFDQAMSEQVPAQPVAGAA